MKILIRQHSIILLLLLGFNSLSAQVAINKDSSPPSTSSIFQVKGDSTNKNIIILPGINGSVGIGTTIPNTMLQINSLINQDPFRVQINGNSRLFTLSNGGTGIGSYTPDLPIQGLYVYGDVGIGEIYPDAKLHVNGQIKITGGSPGIGKVLTSDAYGLASWQIILPTNTSIGDILYYNGTNWINIPAGNDNAYLRMSGGVPVWQSGVTATVTTTAILESTDSTATGGGNVTIDGGSTITARGVCWSTSSNPTIAGNTTNDGTGIGSFVSSITGLTASTTYYVRAYATNTEGTAYGNEVVFTASQSTSNTFPGQTISIVGGTFQMGSTDSEADQEPVHAVTLDGFIISKYEITNNQYADYLNSIGANSDGSVDNIQYIDMSDNDVQISYSGGLFVADFGKENHPVILVTWYGAKAYSEYYGGRLPTEAEWEFAARGGNSSNGYPYSGSSIINNVAWNWLNANETHIVGTKNGNELNIFDMSGNVSEWCNDYYVSTYYSISPTNNPQGPLSGPDRVTRGGSWSNSGTAYCLIPYRLKSYPTNSYKSIGFRPVFDL